MKNGNKMSKMNDMYSVYKSVKFLDRLIESENGIFHPVTLSLSLTDRCNQSCYYCYLKGNNNKGNYLETESVINLLRQAKDIGIKAVDIAGGGEPSFHPDFDKIIDTINELDLELGLITNGTRVDSKRLRNAKWIRFSIDTFDRELYKKIRKTKLMPDFEEIKKICDNPSTVAGVSCVVNEFNVHDLYDFVNNAKQFGFDNVWLKPMESDYNTEINRNYSVEIEKQLERILELETSDFHIYYRSFDESTATSKNQDCFSRCIFQRLTVHVSADGYYYPCCSIQAFPEHRIEHIDNLKIGEMLSLRSEIRPEECPIFCFQAKKNEFMNYLLNDDAPHINFI